MMSRNWLAGLLALAVLAVGGGAMVARAAAGSPAAPVLLVTPTPKPSQPPQREIGGDLGAAAISSFESQTPTCYRPVAGTGACYIQWNYLYVAASAPSYVISMTVTIDGRLRAYYSGFFQTSMYVPPQMHDTGFRVACGAPGAGGVAGLGNTYTYIIAARETGGPGTQRSGSVTCPAGGGAVFLPVIQKP